MIVPTPNRPLPGVPLIAFTAEIGKIAGAHWILQSVLPIRGLTMAKPAFVLVPLDTMELIAKSNAKMLLMAAAINGRQLDIVL